MIAAATLHSAPGTAERVLHKRDLEYRVFLLGDPLAGRGEKLAACADLERAGAAAVPLLAARAADRVDAVFLDDVEVETGPMNAGPPARVRTTARFMAQLIAYRIIAPREDEEPMGVALGARSSSTGIDAVRPAGLLGVERVKRPPLAWVRDWSRFAREHEGESVEALRRWSQGEIDRLWHEAAMKLPAPPPASGGAARSGATPIEAPLAARMAVSPNAPMLEAWSDPRLVRARAEYAKAKKAFDAASKDASKRAAARALLQAAAKGEPLLAPHVRYWLDQL